MACSQSGLRLCAACRSEFRRAAPRPVGQHLLVIPALAHESVARRLVHQLKYHGMNGAARALAAVMVPCVPDSSRALVPIPRVWTRLARFGIDPGRELARELGGLTGLPVVSCLAAPVWAPAHAGTSRRSRRPPKFRVQRAAPVGSVLVDDVITTGATLAAAAESLGVGLAVTATSAGV